MPVLIGLQYGGRIEMGPQSPLVSKVVSMTILQCIESLAGVGMRGLGAGSGGWVQNEQKKNKEPSVASRSLE